MSKGSVKRGALDFRREFGNVLREEIRRTIADETHADGKIR